MERPGESFESIAGGGVVHRDSSYSFVWGSGQQLFYANPGEPFAQPIPRIYSFPPYSRLFFFSEQSVPRVLWKGPLMKSHLPTVKVDRRG